MIAQEPEKKQRKASNSMRKNMNNIIPLLNLKYYQDFQIKGDESTYFFTNWGLYKKEFEDFNHSYKPIKIEDFKIFQLLTDELEIDRDYLNGREKKWLGDFISPFQEEIDSITKYVSEDGSEEWLVIEPINDHNILLPHFQRGRYYKNLLPGRHYKLEEFKIWA